MIGGPLATHAAPEALRAADLPGPLGTAVLALNNAHAEELSLLSADRLRELLGAAFRATRIGGGDAFLLALDQDAAYDSPNFLWFRDRFERFVYVDRLAVAPSARRRGHARALYHDLFGAAARAGHARVVCEVNAVPPNPASDAFHAALGFAAVGRAVIQGGRKTVRYLARGFEPGDGSATLLAPPTRARA